MESETYWKVEDMAIGDFIEVQIINKKGDKNLDGMILRGTIVELSPSHNMVKLHTEWCCHTKDKLLKHIPKVQMSKLSKEELLKVLKIWYTGEHTQAYKQIWEMIQREVVKLHEANVPWIYDIIQIVLESVSCDHQVDSDGAGKTYDDVSYCLDDEEDVLKKCVEAIPEVELKLDVDEKFMEEKAKKMADIIVQYRHPKKLIQIVNEDDCKDFLRSFIKELQEKIK